LAESLRRNAETLLLDVTRAHRALTARLDEAGVDTGPALVIARGGRAPAARRADADFAADVPEFIPPTPRRG
ncbi:MAG TPA: hypothetical protein VM266_16380, partial [Solirubrobacteraceae bacterium]|nr:hypothetical protein [Solirubrobacteraceae bacterium]